MLHPSILWPSRMPPPPPPPPQRKTTMEINMDKWNQRIVVDRDGDLALLLEYKADDGMVKAESVKLKDIHPSNLTGENLYIAYRRWITGRARIADTLSKPILFDTPKVAH